MAYQIEAFIGSYNSDITLEKYLKREDTSKINFGILRVFLMAYDSDAGPRIISILYSGLDDLKGENTSYIKEKWEKERNFSLQLEVWEKLNEKQWKSTAALSWRKFGWKNLTRFFKTPAQNHFLNKKLPVGGPVGK